jgi:tagatose-1,6-bisphosphate aldolase non-catalytic subunit AgaZ/GatZ
MGVTEIKLAGVPLSQYETYKDNPFFQKANEIESQQIANNAAKVAKEAEEAAAAALAIADNSEKILQEYMATIAGLRIPVAGSGSGTVNNITINTPVGSEEALTEAVQKAVQQINRYGFSSTYAGAIPTP